uniref:BHLH domain-containing protein n=1 Tax=Strongyloides papillosus TaxID=174720 RepID=A0A0N5C486_STREA
MKPSTFTTIREKSNLKKTSKKVGNKIKKNSNEKKEKKKTIEILKNLVGSSNDCSQLEVMQAVIDYIASLKKQLSEDYDTTTNVMESEASDLAKVLATSFN